MLCRPKFRSSNTVLALAAGLLLVMQAPNAVAAPPGGDLEVVEDPTDTDGEDETDAAADESPQDRAVREYTEKFVHFHSDPREGALTDFSLAGADSDEPYRGLTKKRLTATEFYDLVGDETHAKRCAVAGSRGG